MVDPQTDPSPTSAWSAVDRELRNSVPETTHELWFKPLSAISYDSNRLVVGGPERIVDWVNRRYIDLVSLAARKVLGDDCAVVISVGSGSSTRSGAKKGVESSGFELNPAQSFETLVIGAGNRVAHAAALAVSESPSDAYSPLFLHGVPGVGKTHLLNSIGNYINAHHPHLNVRLTSGEKFTSEFVASLKNNGSEVFKEVYRKLDVLLIDDIQVFEGKPRTEDEFLHTFNALHGAGKQIVLTSDRPTDAMPALAQRVRDRLAWGLTAEVEPPDLRTRLALVWRMKANMAPGIVDPDALRAIADRSGDNARLLEGAITRVLALSSILSEPVTADFVARTLPAVEPIEDSGSVDGAHSVKNRLTPDDIREAVAGHFQVTIAQLDSRSRASKVAKARQVSMYLCSELLDMNTNLVGKTFGRDQSTVAHAIRVIGAANVPGNPTAGDIQQIRITLSANRDNQSYPAGDDLGDRR